MMLAVQTVGGTSQRFFLGTFLEYLNYACQSGNRTEVITHAGSSLLTNPHTHSLALQICHLFHPLQPLLSSPFFFFFNFLLFPCFPLLL